MKTISVKQTVEGRPIVVVERYDLRSGWHTIQGESHRSWVVTLAPEITDWLKANAPNTEVRDGFLHDDYVCSFSFIFVLKSDAEKFVEYLKAEWSPVPKVLSETALTTFFYLLGRDKLPLGEVEQMLRDCKDEKTLYSNIDLHRWAKRMTGKLKNG